MASSTAYDMIPIDISSVDDELTERGACDGFYIGGEGVLVFETRGEREVSPPVIAGGYILCGGVKVVKVGTTATDIFALYNAL